MRVARGPGVRPQHFGDARGALVVDAHRKLDIDLVDRLRPGTHRRGLLARLVVARVRQIMHTDLPRQLDVLQLARGDRARPL